jgi:predicted flap endonuclease-1-like 5' DNA nuclease
MTAIKGIGPVYASRLADIGVVSFHALANTDAHTIVSATGASAGAVDEWIAQAKGRTS